MMHISAVYVTALVAVCMCPSVLSFREWNYSVTESTSSDLWRETWSLISDEDAASAPRPRRGHSIVVAGDNLLILFGGRGNEADATHIPKTYNVEKAFPSLPCLASMMYSML